MERGGRDEEDVGGYRHDRRRHARGLLALGKGPPLVLVHGTAADHSRWRPVLPALEERFTVYAIDRRGRGGSGDSDDYAVEREFEDVAAMVDSSGSR